MKGEALIHDEITFRSGPIFLSAESTGTCARLVSLKLAPAGARFAEQPHLALVSSMVRAIRTLATYWNVTPPVLTVAAGNTVVPSFSVRLVVSLASVATVTVNGTPVEGAVPSAMSTVQVPEKVAVLASL